MQHNTQVYGMPPHTTNITIFMINVLYFSLYMTVWCGPRIASLTLPRYVVRGDKRAVIPWPQEKSSHYKHKRNLNIKIVL